MKICLAIQVMILTILFLNNTAGALAQTQLYSWGNNGNRQLGDGTNSARSVPGFVKPPQGSHRLNHVIQVATGWNYNLALRTDGTVWAWGFNLNGQLGNGQTSSSMRPVQVQGPEGTGFLTEIQSVAATEFSAFALKNNGTLWAWGKNDYGQLGDGTTTDRLTPVQVRGPEGNGFFIDVVKVAGSSTHTLAVRPDGTLWGWGNNAVGQLGDGTLTNRLTPVQVKGPDGNASLTDVATVAGGLAYTLAVKSDGTVWAWGWNGYGQLGDGTTTNRALPVQVKGQDGIGFLTNVVAVAAGGYYGLALKADGTVWTWGWNIFGQLGDGTTTDRLTPVQVKSPDGSGFLTNIRAIAAGLYFNLALRQEGSVWGWGENGGQLGTNTVATRTTLPVQMHGPNNVGFFTEAEGIGAGFSNSAILRADGTVWCSGSSSYGELGNDSLFDSLVPVSVVGIETPNSFQDAQAIVSGFQFSVALKNDGTVWAWGHNFAGQLGDGTTENRSPPVQVKGTDGNGFLTDIVALAAGEAHAVALKSDGTVWVWGWNYYRQLGDGTTTDRLAPIQVRGPDGDGYLSDIVAIAAGRYHTLALHRNGTVYAWGSNSNGQLGDGTTTIRTTSVQVLAPDGSSALGNIVSIAAGIDFSVVMRADNTLLAWGSNHYGCLGDGTQTQRLLPVRVKGPEGVGFLTDVVAVETKSWHTLALKSDGTVWAWGVNNYGQLGDGSTTTRLTPIQVKGSEGVGFLTDVVSVTCFHSYTMALKSDGTAWSWGYNLDGQLGDGTQTQRTTPVPVKGVGGTGVLTNLIAISAGDFHAVAMDGEGVLQGSVLLQSFAGSSASLRFEFRPVSNAPFTRTVSVGALGRFSFTDIPPGEYDVAVKGNKWLQRTVRIDTTTNNILNLRFFLLTGDANDDNSVDVLDLDILIQAFDSTPLDFWWNEGADFNSDGSVDVLDLDLLIQNFDQAGDP